MMMNYSSNSKIDRRNSTNTNQNYSYTNLSDTGTPNKSQASAKHISAKKQQVIAGLQKYQYQDSSPSKSQINKMQNNSNRNNSNDLFNSLFDTMKQNIISENKSNDINNLRFSHNEFMYNTPIGQSQQQIMKEQVIKKYQERKELTIKKYKQIIDDCEKVKDQIIHTETKFHNLLDTLESKFETQMDQQINQFEQKLLSQGAFDITKNWVFSLIVDMEKCTRYSQLKSLQQLEYVQKQKVKFQEFKILQSIDNLMQIQNLPLVKVSSYQKNKGVCGEIQELIKIKSSKQGSIQNNSQIEVLAVIKNKPYMKQNNLNCRYQINKESSRFIDVQSLLEKYEEFSIAKEKLFHITQNKIILKSDNGPTVSFQDNLVIINQFLKSIQDPQYSSRDLRVFICSKQLSHQIHQQSQNISKVHKKLLDDSLQLQEEQNEYESDFEQENNSHRDSKIQKELEDFFIIEENSAFSIDEMSSRVITKERRVQKIRKLNDVEVASLILQYYQAKELAQNLEIKFNQDLIRKMNEQAKQQFNQNSELSPHLEANRFDSQNNYNYILINKVDKSSKLVIKQYLIRQTFSPQNSQINPAQLITKNQKHAMQCNWPNCLQIIDQKTHQQFQDLRSIQLLQSAQVSSSSRKRPQSGTKNSQQKDQAISLKMTRLNFYLDLELQESQYLRFFKKFKLTKDKSSRTLIPQLNSQASNSTNTSLQQVNQNQNIPNLIGNSAAGVTTSNIQQILNTLTSQSTTHASSFNQHSLNQGTLDGRSNQGTNGINLVPQSVICNSFIKALRNYYNWRDEIKNSLIYDLLIDTGKGNYMLEIVHKLFNFSINQSRGNSGNINIYSLLEILQQQPQQINNLENFLKWLDSYISNQKLIFMKNPHFQEANSHFTNQIAQFNGNLTQALENEKYIVNEMKQWVEQSQQIPKQFIKENLGQIFEVIKTKDMIMKFQQFQFIIDKVNSLRNNTNPAGQYDQYLTLLQRYPQNQFLNQFNQFQQQNQQTPFNYQQASQSILPKITDGNTPISMNQTTAQNFYNANKMNNINIQGNNSSVNNRIGIIGSNNSGGDGSSKNSQNSNNNINNFGNQQSQVVEKLTSIYGGPSLKKNQTVGDQATSNVKQMIEQRLISSDTQNFSLKQSSQMPQSNSLLARKQSAGSRKDFVLPPPSTQELQNLSQMNSTYMKNNLPLSNQKIPSMQNIQNQQNSLILANNEYAAGIQKKQAIKHIGQIKIINSNANNASNCQSSPLSRSLYKVNFGQQSNNGQLTSTGGIQVQHKQRASSAYKQRQDGNMIIPLPQAQTQQVSNAHIRPSSSTSHQYLPPQNSQLSNPLQQVQGPYQQQLQSLQHLQANNFINQGLPPTKTLISNTPVPQMFMGNMMNQQQQINYQYPNQMFQQQQQQQYIYTAGMPNNADPLQNQYNFAQSSNSNFGMPIVATSILQNRKSEGPSSQVGGLPAPKYPINNQFTPQQMQLQQIYNTKLNKPVLMGQQTMTQGFFNNNQQQQQVPQNPLQHAHTSIQISTSKQRQQERQNAIVMTYTNAVPRINSANPSNTDKKLGGGNKQALGGTFYGDSKIGSTITTTGKKSKKANRDTSDRKQTKLNNFLKN
eukprot:403373537